MNPASVPLTLRSPVDSNVTLQSEEIEPGLIAYRCSTSGGVWIPLQSFLAWKENRQPASTEPAADYAPVTADDSKRRSLICPESGRLLIRYKVGHGLNFYIDRSPMTGGIWLDQGEWEALKSRGLHVELNHIFTASYQRQVRAAESEQALDQAFRTRIGAEDFARASDFKAWLATHPERRSIFCFLLDGLDD